MPFEEKADQIWEKAWEEGLSNDIIVLGKREKLELPAGSAPIVRNFLDVDKKTGRPCGYFYDVKTPDKGPTGEAQPPVYVALKRTDGQDFVSRKSNKGVAITTIEGLKELVNTVVLHTDITVHALSTLAALKGRDLSSHFCINWNGIIYQYADLADYTAHAGKDFNRQSIGIDLNLLIYNENNLGAEQNRDMKRTYDDYTAVYRAKLTEMFRAQGKSQKDIPKLLEDYEREKSRTMVLNGQTLTSPGYTPKQYEATIALLKLFVKLLDLPKMYPMKPDGKVLDLHLEGDDAKKLKGIIAHWHVSFERWDPGPGFDWERVLAGLTHEHNSFPISWDKSHVIQSERDIKKVHAAAQAMKRHTETMRLGGTFPLGPNQTWHGGVHFFPAKATLDETNKREYPVQAMFDGYVVAAHFEPERRSLGHNNFVLLRHDLQIPKRDGSVDKEGNPATLELRFWVLYMHLMPMDVTAEGAKKLAASKGKGPAWITRLHELSQAQEDKNDKGALAKKLKSFEERLKERDEKLRKAFESGAAVDDELTELVIFTPAELDDKYKKKLARFLKMGDGVTALIDPNQVAILYKEDGLKVKVSAGEILGYCGEIAVPTDEGEPKFEKGAHIEVFGNSDTVDAIDLDNHAEHFRTPQRARSANLTVTNADILGMIKDPNTTRAYRGLQLWSEERIAADDIRDFYARGTGDETDQDERYREQLRRSITYHVSEWSDQVDWIASLLRDGEKQKTWAELGNDTDFKAMIKTRQLFSREIRKFLPYVWLTEEVAKAIGLLGDKDKWDGRVYHFHPIHWLMWVTYDAMKRNRVFRTTLSLADLRRRREELDRKTDLASKGQKILAANKNDPPQAEAQFGKWLGTLDKELEKRPFYITKETKKKKPELSKKADELKKEIEQRARQQFGDKEEDDHQGVSEVVESTFANPKEVLKDLFDLPKKFEWKLGSAGLDSEE